MINHFEVEIALPEVRLYPCRLLQIRDIVLSLPKLAIDFYTYRLNTCSAVFTCFGWLEADSNNNNRRVLCYRHDRQPAQIPDADGNQRPSDDISLCLSK